MNLALDQSRNSEVLAEPIETRLAAQRQVDALTPSLLASAVRGHFVSQDQNDEAAEHLLERARQKHEGSGKGL